MEFALKNYKCSFCNNDNTKPLLKKQGFTIVKCNSCGFVYVNPRIADEALFSIYEHNYFANKNYGYVGYEQEKRLRLRNFDRWLKDAETYLAKRDPVFSLDVGCAAGYCLDLMIERGWNATGIELDREMYNKLKAAGYQVSNSTIADFQSVHKFDMITLFDVVEHLPGIDSVLTKLNSLLSDDGIIVIVTPDHNSFQRKLFGKRWFQYKPIEHIQYFDSHTLKAFAGRNGLEIVSQRSSGQYADTQFLVNRLQYYGFKFFARVFNKLFRILRLSKSYFYTDTGSLFVILKHKST